MAQLTVTSVNGLEIQSNSFTAADGTFQRAKNVVAKNKNRLQKRRGFSNLTNAATVPSSSTLIPFKSSMFIAYNSVLGRLDTVTGGVNDLSGALTVSAGAKIRYSEASNNLYLASAAGVRKLESTTGSLTDAGLPAALDLAATATVTTGGFMAPGQIAYQVTFVRTDSNENLLESAPSEYARFTNSPLSAASSNVAAGTATITIPAGHGLTVGQTYTITVSVSANTAIPIGVYFALAATTTTLTFAQAGTATGAVTVTVWRNVSVNFTVPAGYTTSDFVRLYRTDLASDILEVDAADPTTMQLVSQTAVAGTVAQTIVDSTPDELKGAFLYTNPDRDGAAGANYPPPFTRDIALFRESTFFANTSQHYTQTLDLINTQSTALTSGTSSITVVQNLPLSVTTVAGSGSTWTLLGPGIGNSFSVGDYVYVSGAAIAGNNGLFPITSKTTNTLVITNASGGTDTTASAYFTRRYLANSSEDFTKVYGGDFLLTPTVTSVFDPITNTARSLLRAMNRDTRGLVYGSYVSTPIGAPGEMTLSSRTLTTQFFLIVDSSTTGAAFSPTLPTRGSSILSDDETRPNRLYFSKQGQPEAVPIVQFLDIGPRTSSILRIIPLRDTLIVVTTKGVYRIVGTNPKDFVAFALDLTVICVAADTVMAFNNLVYMLTNQGVVSVSDSGASVMSTAFEPLLQAASSTSTLSAQSNAVAYETERLYLLSTIGPRATIADVVYCYNAYTNQWTTWDTTFDDAIVNPADDTLYVLSTTGNIRKERKNNNNLDFCDDSFLISLSNVATDGSSATIVGATPTVGMAIVQGSTLGRISSVSGQVVTFAFAVSVVVGAATMYTGILTELFTNPLTGGDPSVMKQYTEFQLQFRSKSCSACTINFGSDNSVLAVPVDWVASSSIDAGWGSGAWGSFTWGDAESINTVYETEANQIVRTYIPLQAQRSTYIMTRILHNRAAEAFDLQALATTARPYSNKTTR